MARVNTDISGTKMDQNLTQMTMIYTTVDKNPLEEMEQPSQSTKQTEMQYLDAILKTTE